VVHMGSHSNAATCCLKVDNVGAGALEAAKAYAAMDIAAISDGWPAGKNVSFSALAETLEVIAGISKRLEIIKARRGPTAATPPSVTASSGFFVKVHAGVWSLELQCVDPSLPCLPLMYPPVLVMQTLVGFFRALITVSHSDLLPAVYLCTARVAPAHEGIELGIGEATLIKALAAATGRNEAALKREAEAVGDLGKVAAASRATQRTLMPPPPLTIAGVFKTFREIAAASGSSSQVTVGQTLGSHVYLTCVRREMGAGHGQWWLDPCAVTGCPACESLRCHGLSCL